MHDMDGNKIKLNSIPNPHILAWGKSGQGKTFFFNRRIEDAVKQNKYVLIIDYSGSFTKIERYKARLNISENAVCEIQMKNNPYYYEFYSETKEAFEIELAGIVVKVLRIQSYFQKKLMIHAIHKYLEDAHAFNFSKFMLTLEKMHEEYKTMEGRSEERDNTMRLLNRLEPYSKLDKFNIVQRTEKQRNRFSVNIVQISEFTEIEKQFLAKIMLELQWEELRRRMQKWDLLVLDEIQILDLYQGSALYNFLREGRKYGAALLLGTQFISNYDKESMESLLQAGNILIFQPTSRDLRFSAEIIDFNNANAWKQMLSALHVGEAVVKGNYSVNDKKQNIAGSIVCRI